MTWNQRQQTKMKLVLWLTRFNRDGWRKGDSSIWITVHLRNTIFSRKRISKYSEMAAQTGSKDITSMLSATSSSTGTIPAHALGRMKNPCDITVKDEEPSLLDFRPKRLLGPQFNPASLILPTPAVPTVFISCVE